MLTWRMVFLWRIWKFEMILDDAWITCDPTSRYPCHCLCQIIIKPRHFCKGVETWKNTINIHIFCHFLTTSLIENSGLSIGKIMIQGTHPSWIWFCSSKIIKNHGAWSRSSSLSFWKNISSVIFKSCLQKMGSSHPRVQIERTTCGLWAMIMCSK